MPQELRTIGIIGTGTMGLSIAHVVALAGFNVQLYDSQPDSLANSTGRIHNTLQKGVDRGKLTEKDLSKALDNITIVNALEKLTVDLVIEAIVEDIVVKQELFRELEEKLNSDIILCTNTSSISVTKIASCLKNPQRVLGLHFFNPAHIMKLVEIVSGAQTKKEVKSIAVDFIQKLNKTSVITKDSPGFIVNRVARHFYVESLKVLEEQVASFEDIDQLMEASNFKMGPFKLMDLIGIDTNFAVTSTMFKGFHQDAKFRPSRIQEQKVLAGQLGRKSGQGFYTYE